MKWNSLALSFAAAALPFAGQSADAAWTISVYKAPLGVAVQPNIENLQTADQYLAGQWLPSATNQSDVPDIDFWQSPNDGRGAFTGAAPAGLAYDQPFPGLTQGTDANNNFAVLVTGMLNVTTARNYDFFTRSDDGARLKIDFDKNGIFETSNSQSINEFVIVDNTGHGNNLADTKRTAGFYAMTTGQYAFELVYWEGGGGAALEAGYRSRPVGGPIGTDTVIGNGANGIGLFNNTAHAKLVTSNTSFTGITNFASADALRAGAQAPGFPLTQGFETFNFNDSGADGDFTTTPPAPYTADPFHARPGAGVPGLGAANANDDNDFIVVGSGMLVVPMGGVVANFRSNSDDGARLMIDYNRDNILDVNDIIILRDGVQASSNTDSGTLPLAEGNYLMEYTWFERAGGGGGEVSVSIDNDATFTLLGDDAAVAAGKGLEVIGGPTATPGDFDADGDVDGADFLKWQRGETTPPLSASALSDWKTNFGASAVSAIGAVPEPSSAVLCLASIVLAAGASRRRS